MTPLRSLSLLRTIATLRLTTVVACCLLAGCATLPDASLELQTPHTQLVAFEGARGPVSEARNTIIMEGLKRKSGDIDILDKHLAMEQAINADSPLVLGNKLVLLQDGLQTYQAMFAAIRVAKNNIHLETYTFEDDEIGQQFADLLLKKQAEGIRVNLVYDSVGCLNIPKEFFARLSAGGIQILEFNPVNPLAWKKKEWLLNNRDHRKLLVVDGRIAFVGGVNISESYSSGSSIRSSGKKGTKLIDWRDTHLQIEGPVVAEFQKLFMDTWSKQKGPQLDDKNNFPKLERQGNDIVRAIGSASADPHSLIYLTLLSAIDNAQLQVSLTNAYFVPDPQLLKALGNAAQRGVDVKLMLPGYTDSWVVFHAGRSYYSQLLRKGVKIYERHGAVMHSKTATIDGVWSTIGSTNLDWRSFLHNDEINAVILGRDFSQQMDTMFTKDLAESDAIELEQWENRSLLLRLKEKAARIVEYWL